MNVQLVKFVQHFSVCHVDGYMCIFNEKTVFTHELYAFCSYFVKSLLDLINRIYYNGSDYYLGGSSIWLFNVFFPCSWLL